LEKVELGRGHHYSLVVVRGEGLKKQEEIKATVYKLRTLDFLP
jgi:hypothetical protein